MRRRKDREVRASRAVSLLTSRIVAQQDSVCYPVARLLRPGISHSWNRHQKPRRRHRIVHTCACVPACLHTCTWSNDALCFASEHSWYMAAMNETDTPRLLDNVSLLHVPPLVTSSFSVFFSVQQCTTGRSSSTEKKVRSEYRPYKWDE